MFFPPTSFILVFHRPRHVTQNSSKKRWWPSPSQRGPPPIQGGPLRKGQWKVDYQPSRLARENGGKSAKVGGERKKPQTSSNRGETTHFSPENIGEFRDEKHHFLLWAIWKCLLVSGRARYLEFDRIQPKNLGSLISSHCITIWMDQDLFQKPSTVAWLSFAPGYIISPHEIAGRLMKTHMASLKAGDENPYFRGFTVHGGGGTWRIIPFSKWLVTLIHLGHLEWE